MIEIPLAAMRGLKGQGPSALCVISGAFLALLLQDSQTGLCNLLVFVRFRSGYSYRSDALALI